MKRIFFLAVILFLNFYVFGKIIPINEAQKVALNKFYELTGVSQKEALSLLQKPIIVNDENGEPLYYVFNFSKGGFVIVSAEDLYYPIIGYSDKFTFRNDNQPANVKYWMGLYAKDIKYVRQHGEKAPNASEWKKYDVDFDNFRPTKSKNQVLLNTALWDQGCGWNNYCPEDDGGACGHVWTGCVATAMGIIMKYWNFPLKGEGSHSYYDYPYGTLSANFGQTNYMWEQMDNTQPTDAAALLLFHTGVSVNMNYSPDGSGAYSWDAIDAFKNYFRYNNAAQLYNKSDYDLNTWINMLRNQLDLGRVIYYAGRDDDNAGHAFVCDGYDDSNNYFHFNFGWSGYNNGFYALDDVGGFHNNQQAGLDIYPDEDYYPYSTNGAELTATLDTNDLTDFIVDLSWNNVDGADHYVVYRDLDSIANVSTNTYIDNQAEPGDHHYTVRTYFSDGSVALGNDAFVDATYRVTFYIRDTAGNILRNAEVTFNGQTKTATFGSVSFNEVPFGWNYDYTISHSDYPTVSSTIPVLYKDTQITVYMGTPADVKVNSAVKIYPNPANSFITISGTEIPTTVEIYNLSGSLLRKIKIVGDSQINISDLPSGVYSLHLVNEKMSVYQNIVKE